MQCSIFRYLIGKINTDKAQIGEDMDPFDSADGRGDYCNFLG